MKALNPYHGVWWFCFNNKVRHQHGMENDKKWCEMTRIFQSCLRFDSHTTSFWQNTANCHVFGKALSKTLSGTNPKTNSSTSFTESKMLCTGNCSVEFQSGLSVPRLRIWVIQPNEWCKVCEGWYILANFSLQFLEPWQRTVSELRYWYGGGRIRKQLQVVNKQLIFVDVCPKVSAEILCNNFSARSPIDGTNRWLLVKWGSSLVRKNAQSSFQSKTQVAGLKKTEPSHFK